MPGPVCTDTNKQLVNTVVYEGNSSSFVNQLDAIGVMWQISPSYDPDFMRPYTVADYNVVRMPFTGVYIATPTQLNILRASINPQLLDPYSTSGLYSVTYKSDGCQAMANLIVVCKKFVISAHGFI